MKYLLALCTVILIGCSSVPAVHKDQLILKIDPILLQRPPVLQPL